MSNARPLTLITRGKNYMQQSPGREHFTPAQKRAIHRGVRNREAFLRKEQERLAQAFNHLDEAAAFPNSQEN